MQANKHKETILVITAGFLILFLLLKKDWMVYTATAVAFAGIVSPFLARIIHIAWMKLADLLGQTIPKLVLGTIFYGFVVPMGFLSGIFRKDFMFLKKRTDTYYHTRNHIFKAEDFKNPW